MVGTVGALGPWSRVCHCGTVTQPVCALIPQLQSGGLLSGRRDWTLALGEH